MTDVSSPKSTTQLLKSSQILDAVNAAGFAFIPGSSMQAWLLAKSDNALQDWPQFVQSWNEMPLDEFMADGGRYRRRRYATLSVNHDGQILLEPHQPHYQGLEYNALNGGVPRHFAPILPEIVTGSTLQSVLQYCVRTFNTLKPSTAWHVEVHQFRIEAGSGETAKPTPEGIHRDGVDFVLVMMVKRQNISSGTTTLHDLSQHTIDSFTLTSPLDCALVDDHRCMHAVTPIQPIDPLQPAYRDVLVVTFRSKER